MSVADECAAWRAGTLDTWSDPNERRFHDSAPGGFTSQARQDRLLWDALFSKLNRTGRYIDCAANHYKRISNTYFYDRCASWHGLCVEPNPIYHEGLRSQRTCRLAPTCMSDDPSKEVDMLLPPYQWLGGMGGIGNGTVESLIRRPTGAIIRRAPLWSFYPPQKWKRTRMHCSTLADEVRQLGWAQVDFLSLDVEGHEASVLRGIDWQRVRIDYILCERNCDAELRPRGYRPQPLPPPPGKPKGDELLWVREGLPKVRWRGTVV